MTNLERLGINYGRTMLSAAVGVLLGFLVVITFVDVIGRKLGHPISFAFELTQIAMGLMIYIGLPLVTARREHIVIDLVVMTLSPRVQHVLLTIMDGLCGVMGLVWSWQLWLQAGKLAASNNVFMFTRWPIAPIVYMMSVMTFIMACVYLRLFLSDFVSRQTSENGQ
jgi:TRAP-type C4-dicarboxylate transport system permease small subunit